MKMNTSSTPRYVLIVEDDNDLREVLKLILEVRFGCEVAEAPDGETALQLAKQRKPDLILMDLVLPNMNGMAAMASLRGTALIKQTPIIVVSDHCWDIKVRESLGLYNVLLCVDKAHLMEELPPLLVSVLGIEEK